MLTPLLLVVSKDTEENSKVLQSFFHASPCTSAPVFLAHPAAARSLSPTPLPPHTINRVTRLAQQTPQVICTAEGDIAETKLISQWAAADVVFANRDNEEDFFAHDASSRR